MKRGEMSASQTTMWCAMSSCHSERIWLGCLLGQKTAEPWANKKCLIMS